MSQQSATLVAAAPSPDDGFALLAELAFGTSRAAAQPVSGNLPSRNSQRTLDPLELDLSDPSQCAFGDYTLLARLGQGGMGIVYRAHQHSLDREVAIKLLAAGPWASPGFIERFRQEAQSAARMQHPNIVTIHEIGEHDGLPFFSMRLVRGDSLAQRLHKDGAMSPIRAATLMRSIAEAVEYAHRLGVLHLDLKPGNVLLDEQGEALVADFGLARRLEEILAGTSEEISGTPSYMAPEQVVAGGRLGIATDVYALGATLYEMLTRQPPFRGVSARETLEMVATTRVTAPRALDKRIPLDLQAICLKCLARDPAQRYASARALAEDLGAFLHAREVQARPQGRVERLWRAARREPRISALALLLFASLVGGVLTTSSQWQRAEAGADLSNKLLWESRREATRNLAGAGRGFAALPRLALNIAEQEGAGLDSGRDRLQLGLLLSRAPVLIDQIRIDGAAALAAELSPDGTLLAIGCDDFSVRWFDSATLTERGRLSVDGRPTLSGMPHLPMLLRFVDNQRLLVTLDWPSQLGSPVNHDSHLVDLALAAFVEPPANFADLASVAYALDARHAVLFGYDGRMELWQVEPWQRLMPITPVPGHEAGRPWIGRSLRYLAVRPSINAMSWVELEGAGRGQVSQPQEIADIKGASAHAESHDGRLLALGDRRGFVHLVDTESRAVRPLKVPAGETVTSLAFSEDDAWLVSGHGDGRVQAIEIASGEPLSTLAMESHFKIERVGISRARRLLIAAGSGAVDLWHLPPHAGRSARAERLWANPTPHDAAGLLAIGWSFDSGLLTTAGLDGSVRLWRLPAAAELAATSARLHSEGLRFDGRRVVDVHWDRVRVRTLDGASSTWVQLAQPPGFAELSADGQTLVASVGATLEIRDASTLALRMAPIALANSPQRLLPDRQSRYLLLGFAGSDHSGFVETLQLIDLRSGLRVGGDQVLGGPSRFLAFDNDGERIVAVGAADSSTTVYRTNDFSVLGSFVHDPDLPVRWAGFPRAGAGIWLLIAAGQEDLASADALLLWDPVADSILREQALPGTRPFTGIDTPNGPYVVGWRKALFDPGGPRHRELPFDSSRPPLGALALSPDGQLLAHAGERGVQLYLTRSGDALGAPMPVPAQGQDWVSQLAFAPDGGSLLARTGARRWLHWRIEADRRPVEALLQDAQLLDTGAIADAAPDLRRRLRVRDHGNWPAVEVQAALPAIRMIDGVPLPPRSAAASALQLDLGPVYNVAADSERDVATNAVSSMAVFPVGLQRLRGIDFDIRGAVQLHQADMHSDWNYYSPRVAAGIDVPAVAVAALHVLIYAPQQDPVDDELDYAYLRLHYRDGSAARVAIRTGRDVPGYSAELERAPMAWADTRIRRLRGWGAPVVLAAPRLVNPHPDRLIARIDLEALPVSSERESTLGAPLSAPVFFAVTVEPAVDFNEESRK
jgi:WD40 repeat protein